MNGMSGEGRQVRGALALPLAEVPAGTVLLEGLGSGLLFGRWSVFRQRLDEPSRAPSTLRQQSVQKSLSAEGSDGAGCSTWQKSPGKGCVALKPRCSQRSGAKSPEKNGAPDQTAGTQSSPTSLRLQEQPPATCPGAEAEQPDLRASTWPGMSKTHRKAPGTLAATQKGEKKF